MKNILYCKRISIFVLIGVGIITYFTIRQARLNTMNAMDRHFEVSNSALYLDNDNNNNNGYSLIKDIFFYYVVVKSLGYEGVPGFFEQAETYGFLQRLRYFNYEVRESFDFFGFSTQFVEYMSDFNNVVSSNAERFALSPVNQMINPIDKLPFIVTALRTMMFAEESSEFLVDLIGEGRGFIASDFVVSSSDAPFKVIMGNAYSEYFKIGDRLNVNLFLTDIELEIVGFLNRDSELMFETLVDLNYTIIMPIVNLTYEPNDWQEEMFQIFYYAMRNEGIIRVRAEENLQAHSRDYYEAQSKKRIEISGQIEEISRKFNLYYLASVTTQHPFLGQASQ